MGMILQVDGLLRFARRLETASQRVCLLLIESVQLPKLHKVCFFLKKKKSILLHLKRHFFREKLFLL